MTTRKHSHLRTALCLTGVAFALAPITGASAALILTLTPAQMNVMPGDTGTITATLTNTGTDTVSVLGTSNSLNGPSPASFTLDASDFENNLPFTLAASEAYTGSMLAAFTVDAPVGDYSLNYAVDGQGTDSYHAEKTVNFHAGLVTVTVPEPSTGLLLVGLLLPTTTYLRRRRK